MFVAAFAVCKEVGCPHPDKLSEPPWSLSWEQFLDWIAFVQWQNMTPEERAADPEQDKRNYEMMQEMQTLLDMD